MNDLKWDDAGLITAVAQDRLTGQVRDFQFAATFAERESDRRRDAVERILKNRS